METYYMLLAVCLAVLTGAALLGLWRGSMSEKALRGLFAECRVMSKEIACLERDVQRLKGEDLPYVDPEIVRQAMAQGPIFQVRSGTLPEFPHWTCTNPECRWVGASPRRDEAFGREACPECGATVQQIRERRSEP